MAWLYGYLAIGMLRAAWSIWKHGPVEELLDAALVLFGGAGRKKTRMLAISMFWALTICAWPVVVWLQRPWWLRPSKVWKYLTGGR